MIRNAIKHLPGVGARRERLLATLGLDDWQAISTVSDDVLRMGVDKWRRLQSEADRCERALQADDLQYLVQALHPSDHWRLLVNWFDRLTFFDIETTGCYWDCETTVVVFYHMNGSVQYFVRGENLEEALDAMQASTVLVSFNGNTFDVPRLLETFHIPALPVPHLDMRWVCYHHGFAGGLKKIEHDMGLVRPADIEGVDGLEAVRLWQRWKRFGESSARRQLLRYCAADVVGLYWVTAQLLYRMGCPVECPPFKEVWTALAVEQCPTADSAVSHTRTSHAGDSGDTPSGGFTSQAESMLADRLHRQLRKWRSRSTPPAGPPQRRDRL